jgi:hypothetical protein
MAQIIAQVKGLTMQVKNLEEKEAKRNENTRKTDQILTLLENIDARVKVLESTVGEGIKTRARGSSGGKSTSSEHPLLKVSHDSISPVPSVLKTSARGAHNVLSDVWSGGDWEQG